MKLRILISLGVALFSVWTAPVANADASTGLSLDSVAWLEGRWAGEGFGGQVEEYWMRAPDGRLTGVFQYMLEGRQVFSEIMILAEFQDGAALRLKHFDEELKQWESDEGGYVSFALQEVGEGFFQCEGLRYELQGEILSISLNMKADDGTTMVESIIMRRK